MKHWGRSLKPYRSNPLSREQLQPELHTSYSHDTVTCFTGLQEFHRDTRTIHFEEHCMLWVLQNWRKLSQMHLIWTSPAPMTAEPIECCAHQAQQIFQNMEFYRRFCIKEDSPEKWWWKQIFASRCWKEMLIPSTLIELMCRSPDSRSLAKASLQNRKESKCFIRNASEICPISPMKHVRTQKLKCYQALGKWVIQQIWKPLSRVPWSSLCPLAARAASASLQGTELPLQSHLKQVTGYMWTVTPCRHCPSPQE